MLAPTIPMACAQALPMDKHYLTPLFSPASIVVFAGDAERQRSLARILQRGRNDGAFPLTDPAADAASIDAVCTTAMSGQIALDRGRPGFGKAHVVDFVKRSLGVR